MISFKQKGSFKNLERFLSKAPRLDISQVLHKYGAEGVAALSANTPIDTGKTAQSWSYEIVQNGSDVFIYWRNSNKQGGVPIAVLLQYGHATKNGGFVSGTDFINPVMKPLFKRIADEAWREVANI